MYSKVSFAAERWGHAKVTSLLTEGYSLVTDLTQISPYQLMAKLRHDNGNQIIILITARTGCVIKNGKTVHEERLPA